MIIDAQFAEQRERGGYYYSDRSALRKQMSVTIYLP